jgi:tetratricopeptide (TPR) repeat protein
MGLLAVIFFVSLLVHEYGHALAVRKFGKEAEVTLEGIGGFTSYDPRGLSEGQSFVVTLCGPLFTGLLVGVGYYLFKMGPSEMRFFSYCLMKLNICWLAVNLAPLVPLDGGRMALFALRRWLGYERGERVTLWIGNITAAVGMLYFLMGENYLFAGLFLFHGWKNYQIFQAGKREQNEFELYNEAVLLLGKEEFERAKGLFEKLMRSKDEYIRVRASLGLANVLEKMGKVGKAIETLEKAEIQKIEKGEVLLCKLAYQGGNYALVEKLSIPLYEKYPTFEVALLNAKAFAGLGNGAFAAAWLETALLFGEGDGALKDRAFDPVRDHPEFVKLLKVPLASVGSRAETK